MPRLRLPVVSNPVPDSHSTTLAVESLPGISGLRAWAAKVSVWSLVFLGASTIAIAQLKEVGPAPFPPTVARQKIRTALERVDASNRRQTVDTLAGLLVWYRDILDDELIAAWKSDEKANLAAVIDPLADLRVASAIVEFSWRQQREAAFNLTYAPMLGMLMLRFPGSEKPFLDDLLGSTAGKQMPELSRPVAEAVCRILLDMPDVGAWKQRAEQILPHYRQAAESVLVRDLHGSDEDKSYQAQLWLRELKSGTADAADRPYARKNARRSMSPDAGGASSPNPTPSVSSVPLGGLEPVLASAPPVPASAPPVPAPASPVSAPTRAPLSAAPALSTPLPYDGPKSGTLECSGASIPQNAEYVFRDVPLGKIQIDYDTKKWDARLAPGEGQTQRLILRNRSAGPQKRCIVHWSIIP